MSEENKPKFYNHINVYDFSCELPGTKQEVRFKPVSTGQLKKLLTYENETNPIIQEQALDELISSSVLSEAFDINELYLEDRFFLLVELRKKTKGEVLEFSLTCPECNSQTLQRVNLDNMPIKPFKEGGKIVELRNDVKVHLKHVKRKDQKEIPSDLLPTQGTDTMKAADVAILYHACSVDKIETIDGIDDNLTIADKKYLIENIPMDDYDKIREGIDDMSFGVDISYKATCGKCGFSRETDIPLENNFFS